MENRKSFIINVLFYGLIFALVYVFCNYLLGIFAPFMLGFMFAYVAIRLSKKIFKIDKKSLRIITLILIYIVVAGIIVLLTALGINQLIDFIASIPILYKQYVEPVLIDMNNGIKTGRTNMPFNVQTDLNDILNNVLDSIKTFISNISSYIVTGATSLISNTTNILIAVLTTLITSFFVAADYETVVNYLESLMTGKVKEVYEEVCDFLINTVFLVIESYGLIMFITFVELFIGLMLIGVDNFALVSLIISVLDILPVLGVGTVLIPWAIFELIVGKTGMAIALGVLYLIITIIRNIIEPKIVGGNLELHPLATLFAMLVGLQLFGVLGLFGLPLLMSFLVKRSHKNEENGVK